MESTPVSRASFGTRWGGRRLQGCPRTLSLDGVGLVFLFFSPLSSDRVKEPFQPLFLCFNQDSYGMVVSFLPSRARLLPRWYSLSAAAIVRLHITPCTAAITVILATRTTATTRATTATAGEVTIGLGGAIAITVGIMAGGGGTGGAADTAGMAAD